MGLEQLRGRARTAARASQESDLGVDSSERPDAAKVRSIQFREAWRGYDPDAIDALLDRVAAALESGTSLRPLLAHSNIPTCFRGYRRDEVDTFLERLRLL
jgi:DivIVA domain-containing protein